jgi:hypothetical protein
VTSIYDLTMGMQTNSIMSLNKCVTIIRLNQNQLQITNIHAQVNAIIKLVHNVVNEMLRSFELENNHENIEE